MISVIKDLIDNHGIASATVSVKPHNDSIAATINLIPNLTAIADDAMRQALICPVVLIGEEAVNSATADSIMEKVRLAIVGNEYFDSEAIKKRIESAKPKAAAKVTSTAKKADTPKTEASKVTPPPPPADLDSLFSGDSL